MKGLSWLDQEESNLKAIDGESEFPPYAPLLRCLEVFGLIPVDGLRKVGSGRQMKFLGKVRCLRAPLSPSGLMCLTPPNREIMGWCSSRWMRAPEASIRVSAVHHAWVCSVGRRQCLKEQSVFEHFEDYHGVPLLLMDGVSGCSHFLRLAVLRCDQECALCDRCLIPFIYYVPK